MGAVRDWGQGWAPLDDDGNPHELELARELSPGHPLHGVPAAVFGRCRSCDDVVAALAGMPGERELAVVHLTWRGAPDGSAEWPYFERLTTQEFLSRFIEGGEHL